MTLEEKLRGLAAKGELTHFSVAFTDGMFKAMYTPAGQFGFGVGIDATDPVKALEIAIEQVGIRPKRPPKETVIYSDPAIGLTVTQTPVTEPQPKEGTLPEWMK